MANPYPEWLHLAALAYLAVCALIGAWIIVDLVRHRQKMWIMNLVWPATALYFGPAALWLYVRTRPLNASPQRETENANLKRAQATIEQVSIATFHCGAGCAFGDVVGEFGLFALGTVAFVATGSDFATKLVVDFLLAFTFGVVFQYFTIAPMRGLGIREGFVAALRADTISIVAFQVGMFVWMAVTHFLLFPKPASLRPNMAVFWFMMQIAMIVGWATSYPANRWLIAKGWKEKMPRISVDEDPRPARAAATGGVISVFPPAPSPLPPAFASRIQRHP